MKEYWLKALNFEEYLEVARLRSTANPNKEDQFQEYYELGLLRMQRALKTFKIDDEWLSDLKKKNFNGKILIISEPWCGDASATVPVITKFFEAAGVEVKMFLRDNDTTLIDQFLTNGGRSIPIVIILNEDFSVKNSWGPRPVYGQTLLKEFKENPETYSVEEFHNDLQVYYAKNRGKDAILELLNLI